MVFNMVVLNNIKLHMVLKWSIPSPAARCMDPELIWPKHTGLRPAGGQEGRWVGGWGGWGVSTWGNYPTPFIWLVCTTWKIVWQLMTITSKKSAATPTTHPICCPCADHHPKTTTKKTYVFYNTFPNPTLSFFNHLADMSA